ncbi:exonuclease domain-containing protein [Kineococcus esterisolvens]|uniref:exonuclease domain-containing protein n=1 Tax=unclassified Kineococcus TaxID=2621656 RepID=UPI003D7DC25D
MDFTALDVETANHRRGSICAVGLAVVRDGQVTERHSWLCRPPSGLDFFDGFNIYLHGIRPDDVADQPTFHERLADAIDVIGDLPVVAHNAGFDIGAVREACDVEERRWPSWTYGCSLVMSRASLDLISYRLPLVAAELGIDLTDHHEAGADAAAAAQITLALGARNQASDLHDLARRLVVGLGRLDADAWQGCRSQASGAGGAAMVPPEANPDADPGHPLYGQVVVFTGALSRSRAQMWQAVAALGATPDKGVTKRTTFLVIGDGFTGDDPQDFTTAKAGKAAKARAAGQRIEVLTEADLLTLLADSTTSGQRSSA